MTAVAVVAADGGRAPARRPARPQAEHGASPSKARSAGDHDVASVGDPVRDRAHLPTRPFMSKCESVIRAIASLTTPVTTGASVSERDGRRGRMAERGEFRSTARSACDPDVAAAASPARREADARQRDADGEREIATRSFPWRRPSRSARATAVAATGEAGASRCRASATQRLNGASGSWGGSRFRHSPAVRQGTASGNRLARPARASASATVDEAGWPSTARSAGDANVAAAPHPA